MYIKNVTGSSKISYKPKNGAKSWLNFWEMNTNNYLQDDVLYICPGCGRNVYKSQLDGCHVQKNDFRDQSWYIVPLCDSCNHRADVIDIGNLTMVAVNP